MQSKSEYMEFSVPVAFTFTGTVKVKAESKEQSEEIARNNFGMVASSGSFHDNDSRVVDWTFDTHPEKLVGEVVGKVVVDLNIFDEEGLVVDSATSNITVEQASDIIDHAAQLVLVYRRSQSVDGVIDELDEALSSADVISHP